MSQESCKDKTALSSIQGLRAAPFTNCRMPKWQSPRKNLSNSFRSTLRSTCHTLTWMDSHINKASCVLSIHTVKVHQVFTGSHACLPCCLFSNAEHQKYYSGQTKNRCKVCWMLHLDLHFIHVYLLLALKGSKAIIHIYSKTFHLTWHHSTQT